MHLIKVNEAFDFEIDQQQGQLVINKKAADADIKQLSATKYHVLHNMASYNVEVVNFDSDAKTAEIKVNGSAYKLTAKNQYDLLLDQLGFSNADSARISEIKAPMPGLVLKVFVNDGDIVVKGDNLFVLEAMKMENIIKAPADVVIKKLKIQPGDKVEKNQVLILF